MYKIHLLSSDTNPYDFRCLGLFPLFSKGGFGVSIDKANGQLVFTVKQQKIASHARLRTRQWFHVAFTADESLARLFVNGVLDNSVAVIGTAIAEPASPLYLGGSPSAGSDSISFLMDDVRVFSRALDSQEIEAASFPSLGSV